MTTTTTTTRHVLTATYTVVALFDSGASYSGKFRDLDSATGALREFLRDGASHVAITHVVENHRVGR